MSRFPCIATSVFVFVVTALGQLDGSLHASNAVAEMPPHKARVWAVSVKTRGTNTLAITAWEELATFLLSQSAPLRYHEGEDFETALTTRYESTVYRHLFCNLFVDKWDTNAQQRASQLLEDWEGATLPDFVQKLILVEAVETKHSLNGSQRLSRRWVNRDLVNGLRHEKTFIQKAWAEPEKWLLLRPPTADDTTGFEIVRKANLGPYLGFYDSLAATAETGTVAAVEKKYRELTRSLDRENPDVRVFGIWWFNLESLLALAVKIENAEQGGPMAPAGTHRSAPVAP